MKYLSTYSKYFESISDEVVKFLVGGKPTSMKKSDLLNMLKMQEMDENDFKKLKSKLKSVFEFIGFKITTTSYDVVLNGYKIEGAYYYNIAIDFNLNSVKNSYLNNVMRINNYDIKSKIYFNRLSGLSFTICSDLVKSSAPTVINTTSPKEAYQHILNVVNEKLLLTIPNSQLTCVPMGASDTTSESSTGLQAAILVHFIKNKEYIKPLQIEDSVKSYFMTILTDSKISYEILNSIKKNNKVLYDALKTESNKEDIESASNMDEIGF